MKFDDFKKIPISKLTEPKGGLFSHYVDYWWIVTNEGELLFYHGRSPQCNLDKTIVEHCSKIFQDLGIEYKIIQLSIVYLPIKSNDYDYNL